jgi:hypothetical protein
MNEPTDWIGYVYRPKLTFHDLVLCSNFLQAESKPAKKLGKPEGQRDMPKTIIIPSIDKK